jgi:hypothetical protein
MKDEGKVASAAGTWVSSPERGELWVDDGRILRLREGLFAAGENREMPVGLCDRGIRGKFASFLLGEM